MPENLKPRQIYHWLVWDFQNLWNAAASKKSYKSRGNFTFGILAMTFLEFACRLCESDSSGSALQDFSIELQRIEPRYFSQIPGLFVQPRMGKLPHVGPPRNDLLICGLFDLIRNGIAHQYQQIFVRRPSGDWGIQLSGPGLGVTIAKVGSTDRRTMNHLTLIRDGADTWLRISPARLLLDFREAFDRAELLKRNLTPVPIERPDPNNQNARYEFDVSELAAAVLRSGTGGARK